MRKKRERDECADSRDENLKLQKEVGKRQREVRAPNQLFFAILHLPSKMPEILDGSRFEKGIKEVCTEQGANKEPQIPSLPFSCCLFNCSSPHAHYPLSLSLFAPAYAKKISSVSKAIHSTLAAKGFRQRPSQSSDDLIHHLIIFLLFPASNKCGTKKKIPVPAHPISDVQTTADTQQFISTGSRRSSTSTTPSSLPT